MLRSMSAGILRYGGATSSKRPAPNALPLEARLLTTAGSSRVRRGDNNLVQFDFTRPMTGTSPQPSFDPEAFSATLKGKEKGEANEEKPKATGENAKEEGKSNDELVATLTKQCNNLAWRLIALEEEVRHSDSQRKSPVSVTSPLTRHFARRSSRRKRLKVIRLLQESSRLLSRPADRPRGSTALPLQIARLTRGPGPRTGRSWRSCRTGSSRRRNRHTPGSCQLRSRPSS